MRSSLRIILTTLVAMGVMTAPALAAERPVVKTTGTTNITADSATLNGEVNPEGLETKYYFEYGVGSYEKKTAEFSAGSGTGTLKKSVAVSGLLAGTTYNDVRIVATNSDGTTEGAAVSFKTAFPKFTPAVGQSIKGSSGVVKFSVYGGTITCAKSTTTGAITGAETVGEIVMKLTGCKGKKTTGVECEERSEGAAPEEIVTFPLKGALGTVAAKEAASGVGVYLEAETAPSSATWWKTAQVCLPENKQITGTAAAEVVTIGKNQTTNELVFAPGGKEIKKLTLASGKTAEPELLSWNFFTASIESANELKFGQATEVT
jgi:hypothetical protein